MWINSQWNKKFDDFMVTIGFRKSMFDACVYYKLVNTSHIYLLLYVDDILIVSYNKVEIDKLKTILKGDFQMKDLGPASKILGMKIKRNKKRLLYLKQERYLVKIFEKFGMNNSKPVKTPNA